MFGLEKPLRVDICVTVQGDCPIDYTVGRDRAEIHFGDRGDGFYFEFDEQALRTLMTFGQKALTQLTANNTSQDTVDQQPVAED